MDCTGLFPLDIRLLCSFEHCEVFNLAESCTTPSLKPPHEEHLPLTSGSLSAYTDCFAFERIHSMDDASTKIFGSAGTKAFLSGGVSRGSWKNRVPPYSDDNDENDWDFAEVPVNPHVHVRANLCRGLDAIAKLTRLANVETFEDSSSVFRLALHNLNTFAECNSAVAARPVALKRLPLVKGAAALSICRLNPWEDWYGSWLQLVACHGWTSKHRLDWRLRSTLCSINCVIWAS